MNIALQLIKIYSRQQKHDSFHWKVLLGTQNGSSMPGIIVKIHFYNRYVSLRVYSTVNISLVLLILDDFPSCTDVFWTYRSEKLINRL